jgi:hypothetical protein
MESEERGWQLKTLGILAVLVLQLPWQPGKVLRPKSRIRKAVELEIRGLKKLKSFRLHSRPHF